MDEGAKLGLKLVDDVLPKPVLPWRKMLLVAHLLLRSSLGAKHLGNPFSDRAPWIFIFKIHIFPKKRKEKKRKQTSSNAPFPPFFPFHFLLNLMAIEEDRIAPPLYEHPTGYYSGLIIEQTDDNYMGKPP